MHLKIGDLFEVSTAPPVAHAALAPAPPRRERGYAGTAAFAGALVMGDDIDHLADMRPPERWLNIHKMRKTDGSVRAAGLAVTLPILASPLDVVPGDRSPLARKMADFVREDLANMTVALHDHRREMLLHLPYGVYIFEKVWEYREDGLIHLRKLAPRPPWTVQHDGWRVDETGGPAGIVQMDDLGRPVEIPIGQLLLFINEREGGNIVGQSYLRAAYKHWWSKQALENFLGVQAELHARNIPVGKVKTSGVTSAVKNALRRLRTHEQMYIIESEGDWEFRLVGPEGQVMDLIPALNYHARQIFLSALCPQLDLGSSTTGTFALSRDQTDFLIMSLKSVIQGIEDTYNAYLIPTWMRWNFGTVPNAMLPKVKHGPINSRDLAQWFTAVFQAVRSSVLTPDAAVQAMAREMLDIPEDLPESDATTPQERAADVPVAFAGRTKQANSERARKHLGERCEVCGSERELTIHHVQPGTDNNAPRNLQTVCKRCHDEWTGYTQNGGGNKRITRARLEAFRSASDVAQARGDDRLDSLIALDALGIEPNFVRMAGAMDDARDRIAARVGPRQKALARKVASDIDKIVRRGDAAALEDYSVPYDEEAGLIEDELAGVYGIGAEELEAELRAQGVRPEQPDARAREEAAALLAATSRSFAERLADRMKTAAVAAGLQYIATGTVDRAALALAITAAPQSLLGQLGMAGASLALNVGRRLWSEANADRIAHELYTAAMDERTCDPCAQEDGKQYPVGEGPQCPNPACLGGAKCRCIRVPVAKGRGE